MSAPTAVDVRARIREVLARDVLPYAGQWERQRHISATGWRDMGRAGLFSHPHTGPGFLDSAVLLEELGNTGYAGIRAAVGVHAYMAASYLEMFGSPEQRAAYRPGMLAGTTVAALAISEDAAGSDLRRLSTVATPDGTGGYRVTGVKRHVANGSRAGLFVVLARIGEPVAGSGLTGAALLLVDAGLPGVTREPEPMIGWHAADVCRIGLTDVPVAGNRLIGRPERTLLYLMQALNMERMVAGLLAVGGVMHCVDLVDRFARSHQIKDAPLSANQSVRHRIADLRAQLDLVRQYGYHAARSHSRGELDVRTASVLKLQATELAVSAAQTCVQFHGARGYREDSAAARLYRDAMAGTIAAGASELMREMIFEG
ncbi:acyl-CoA dehydrogenase family protein [Actinoplanes xinjiangensis]|uniref:Alkylation response protein AidB-like acyl-CoA dehydrogenase n=1 Tax=Actinoplanes xinjiangensis TaxID=512350 RepID=A0A316FZD6_9ACTN|nr:acyl-CoA dehydrogenase family protein [Actinoplanes xinjiangensis]PWK47517.1 alkylation response protein AidB-like acyl-CoA dehydrogenase [Actinoplanes xinjiangensis]GIF39555.1 acyl-CoA dehydrogenase [Actinoplanes xinjiangensis]